MERSHVTTWIIDVVGGGFVGILIGAIVAVNIVIFLGPEEGYEADLYEVFSDSPLVGMLALGALVGGPAFGIVLVRRLRRQSRDDSSHENNGRPFGP